MAGKDRKTDERHTRGAKESAIREAKEAEIKALREAHAVGQRDMRQGEEAEEGRDGKWTRTGDVSEQSIKLRSR